MPPPSTSSGTSSAGLSRAERLQLVALETLRRAVVNQTAATLQLAAKYATAGPAPAGGPPPNSPPPPPNPNPPGPPTGDTPAFDRPTPVVIVGPKPLPVTVVGRTGAGKPKPPPPPPPPPPPTPAAGATAQTLAALGTVLRALAAKAGRRAGRVGRGLKAGGRWAKKAVRAVKAAGVRLAGSRLPRVAKAVGRDVGWLARSKVGRAIGGAGKAAGGSVLSALGAPLAVLTRMLGPVSVVMQLIGSQASGFQVVGSAMKLLAGVLAPVLLPGFLMFATFLIQASDTIKEQLMPALSTFFTFMFDTGLPIIRAFFQALGQAIQWLKKYAPGVKNDKKPVPEIEIPEIKAPDFSRPKPGGKGDKTLEAFDTALRSFELSVGPKANMTGLAERNRQAQMAAVAQDPIEQKMLTTMQETLKELREARAQVTAPQSLHGRGAN